MSLRIAVALAATIGAGILLSTAAEARPEMVGIPRRLFAGHDRGEDQRAPALSDRRSGSRGPLSRRRRQGRQAMGGHHADRRQVSRIRLVAAGGSEARQAEDADVIPGGSPSNPMGVAAMTLSGGAIRHPRHQHAGSVGGFVSYGCIRMYNADITDLYQRVSVGTTGGRDRADLHLDCRMIAKSRAVCAAFSVAVMRLTALALLHQLPRCPPL